ncbi:MAG: DUF3417 domain-containing protein, partial [Bacteroidales bacterium]|nr:DUF3417 domain-containing protein [Bacteroidales bacterium]
AQFHEWQTGAGLLYVKRTGIPVATVFTTHATVIGRCLAGHDLPLYDGSISYDADARAAEFGVVARHSLEKAAAVASDVFTTVSDITARECRQFLGRACDVITPNGFENSFTPDAEHYGECRSAARRKLLEVASAMAGEQFSDESLLVAIGGRYEYSNKGIDVFLDALGKLDAGGYSGRKILAFVMVPSGHNGPDKELLSRLNGSGSNYTTQTSHYLMDDYDIVMRRLRELKLNNRAGAAVDVFFLPTYLNGDDGIFNMRYYDLLVGMDLTVFPSYYEPWGYTPLESLAFSVPTTTTSLAGFGLWVREHCKEPHPGIQVIERNDSNYSSVVEEVASRIVEAAGLDAAQAAHWRENAKQISEIALWENNIAYYQEAYTVAIGKVKAMRKDFTEIPDETVQPSSKYAAGQPSWSSVFIGRELPERLWALDSLAKNLWWCWNQSAIDLFRNIDPVLWKETGGNPLLFLDKIPLKQYRKLEKDPEFLARLDGVYAEFKAYMDEKDSRSGA